MDPLELIATARALSARDNALPAMDESDPTPDSERQQSQIRVATVMGAAIFGGPRYPTTGFGNLPWRGRPAPGIPCRKRRIIRMTAVIPQRPRLVTPQGRR